MKVPISAQANLREVPLDGDGRVVARVGRVALSWAIGRAGGTWAMALPLAVVDRRPGLERTRPVIDWTAVLAGAMALAGIAFSRRRKSNA